MTDEARARIHKMYWEKYGVSDMGLVDAAIAVVLDEAAKIAEAKADECATAWRNRFKADLHMEGMSDGADDIAAAIRALIPKEEA